LMLRPRSGAHQWVAREEYELSPRTSVVEFTDGFGNLCQRLIAPVGTFRLHTRSEVEVADHVDVGFGAPFTEIQNLPDAVLTFLLPSRYAEADRLGGLASELVRGVTPGYDQVAAIVHWIQSHVSYVPGGSEVPVSADEVRKRGSGVCRDLAHLAIASCRALSIPARMVVGYLHELRPMDLHAWFEAYVGGRWYTFDPTQPQLRPGYVAVGYGRDAADVAVYNQYGPALLPKALHVKVVRLD